MFTPFCIGATLRMTTELRHSRRFWGLSRAVQLRAAACVLLVVSLCGCASLAPANQVSGRTSTVTRAAIPQTLLNAISAAALPLNSVAILVQPLQPVRSAGDKPAPTISHQPDKAMQPASTMKLMTSAAALQLLGPIHRSAVEWRAPAPVGDTLAGPHHIRGLGHTELNAQATTRWLKTLRDAGVQRISGEVLLDRTLYSPSRLDLNTPPFDEAPEFQYNVVPDALALNTNLMGLRLAATSTSFTVRMDPSLPGVLLEPNFKLIDGKCTDWENGWVLPQVRLAGGTSLVALSGTFPRNCVATTEVNVLDRTQFAAAWLQLMWQNLGGTWDASVRELADGQTAPSLPLQARSTSRVLAETLRTINKSSDNPVTRMTYLALAEKAAPNTTGTSGTAGTAGTTLQRAEAAMRAWMAANQIDATALVLDNGSGLSRSERISPNTLAQTLQVMAQSRWAPEFMSSLPIVAVDGTMRNRGKGTAAAERARMKTGTLRDTFALAGYVQNAKGEWQVVVAMINHDTVGGPKARQVLDAVIEWVAASQ